MSESDDRRVALVTGATRGIGKAIATELANSGCRVIGTATSEAGAATIHETLEPLGGTGICLDVSDAEAVKAAIVGITRDYGAPTVLVNNAGYYARQPHDEDEGRRVVGRHWNQP
jgi:3-oxoacyl-[acyl-carrier protein] reductase